MVQSGGLASLSINYEELGRRAGEMAVEILTEGKDPATMPIETMGADECDLVYNQQTADEVGVDVSALADEGGTGSIVIGLAAIVIGEVLGRLTPGKLRSFGGKLVAAVVGSVVYFLIRPSCSSWAWTPTT